MTSRRLRCWKWNIKKATMGASSPSFFTYNSHNDGFHRFRHLQGKFFLISLLGSHSFLNRADHVRPRFESGIMNGSHSLPALPLFSLQSAFSSRGDAVLTFVSTSSSYVVPLCSLRDSANIALSDHSWLHVRLLSCFFFIPGSLHSPNPAPELFMVCDSSPIVRPLPTVTASLL